MFANDDDRNPYLQQEVLSASPVRLRWMLICRAEELCGMVGHCWSAGQAPEAQQWLLRIREILGELLDGVTDAANPLSQTISDFYLFLLQLLQEVQDTSDVQRLGTLLELLSIERETWQQVLNQHGSDGADHLSHPSSVAASPIGTQGAVPHAPTLTHVPAPGVSAPDSSVPESPVPASPDDNPLAGGAFSLEV